MMKVVHEKVALNHCRACGGTWFDVKELARVTSDKELERRAARVPIVRVPSGSACPACGGECLEGHVDEVEVDTCVTCHGVWLDRGELEAAKRVSKSDQLVSSQGAGFRSFLSRI